MGYVEEKEFTRIIDWKLTEKTKKGLARIAGSFCMEIDTKKTESNWTYTAFCGIIIYGLLDPNVV